MKMMQSKPTIILIAAIMTIAVSALFLVVNITPLFIVAYIFALLGIAGLCLGSLYMVVSSRSYPWFAAFPMTIWRYLLTQLILSAAVLIPDNIAGHALSMNWFLLLHIILLAFFAILLVAMKGGKDVIEPRGAEVKEKVSALRFIHADVTSLMQKMPEYEADLKQVAEAIRYSDPMSHSSLALYDEQIQREILALGNSENVPAQCRELLRLIADRNSRVKIMK